MNNIDQSESLVRELEACERNCWIDAYGALIPDLAQKYQIDYFKIGEALGTLAPGIDVLGLNRAMGFGLGDMPDEQTVDHVIAKFLSAGVKRFFFQLDPIALNGNLPGILISKGFRQYNNWVRLYRDIAKPIPEVKTDLRVERIGAADSMNFASIVTTEFHWPEQIRPWLAALVGRRNWCHYMAFDRDMSVASGAMFIDGEQAWIGFAATREDYRNRGAQAALVARRLEVASSLGCRRIVVETAEDTPERNAPSFRNMIRFGFEPAYKRVNFIFQSE
jgi:GNAT superfamily N-acetyltransferase